MNKNLITYINNNYLKATGGLLKNPTNTLFKNNTFYEASLYKNINNLFKNKLIASNVKNMVNAYTILSMPYDINVVKPLYILSSLSNNVTNEPLYQIIKKVNKVKNSLKIFRI